jgi:hypothetical protein
MQVNGATNMGTRSTIELLVDGQRYGTSQGEVFSQMVRLPSGSHLLTLKAWNRNGHRATATQTVNVP